MFLPVLKRSLYLVWGLLIWLWMYCHYKIFITWHFIYRKLDGRPKLFLRRFFSSIGLNSVGRLVKGGRSSSMEQLSLPTAPRASSASPSPTRRPQPSIRIQRTPSLQTLHTVSESSNTFHVIRSGHCLFVYSFTTWNRCNIYLQKVG